MKPVILVTSFGTSYNDSRHITIGAIEDAIREKYWQDYDIRRAFTAQIIIDKLKKRDGITIDNMTEALDRCVEDGVKEIVVQPTHLMAGLEYADVKDELDKYADKFDKISLGDPLLTSDDDYKKVAAAIKENMASFDDGKTALCLMGHGTEADSNADYAKMQEVFKNEGLTQFFVGTVEADPTCEDVIAAASAADGVDVRFVSNARNGALLRDGEGCRHHPLQRHHRRIGCHLERLRRQKRAIVAVQSREERQRLGHKRRHVPADDFYRRHYRRAARGVHRR